MKKYIQLRKQHPSFVFENYHINLAKHELRLKFEFTLNKDLNFSPELIFPIRNEFFKKRISEIEINNLVFHIGMIELISYWKASCSPKIIIKPHFLDADQINWWKKLYFYGLGEFFHLNGITTDLNSFVDIKVGSDSVLPVQGFDLKEKVLVPVGGGKDSIVSLETLKEGNLALSPLVLNMNPSRERSIRTAGFSPSETIEIRRTIDPKLLELNKQGYLNGHTPFSSVLAFTSILAAVIYNHKHIALSNESSANESTLVNSNINHQYSKSFEFESDFRNYVSKYISPDLNYFSFLRPLNEFQIAGLFSESTNYFPVFRSCNVGSKKDVWCGKCPKCLFTYIILSPYVTAIQLKKIFSKNLFDDPNLTPVFDKLVGNADNKPFECVGTLNDVNAALLITLKNFKSKKLPALLEHYQNSAAFFKNKDLKISKLEKELNSEHFLTPDFLSLLKSKLK